MSHRLRSLRWRVGLRRMAWAGLGAVLAIAIAAFAGSAAERIQFFYGPFEPTIWVEDLAHFAATGQSRDRLQFFTQHLTPAQQQDLRRVLNWQVDLDVVVVDRLLRTSLGDRLFHHLGEILQTASFQNGQAALRAAFIAATVDESGLSPISVVRHYPLETIQLNHRRLQTLSRNHAAMVARQAQAVAALRAEAQTRRDRVTLPRQLPDPQQPGPYRWQRQPIAYRNPLRTTRPVAQLYLPESASVAPESVPVVVFSHGAASEPETFGYLAEHLASHGYGVVMLRHDDTAGQYAQAFQGKVPFPGPGLFLSRPADVTAVLDALAEKAVDSPSLRSLNLQAVAVMGHSFGGYTALAVAGAKPNPDRLTQVCDQPLESWRGLNLSMVMQCDLLAIQGDLPASLRDPRVASAIALNPFMNGVFGPEGLAQAAVPVMVMAGTQDLLTPALIEQIEPFAWLQGDRNCFVVLENATHFSFLNNALQEGVLPLPNLLTGPDRRAAQRHLKALSLSFLNATIGDRPKAAQFLTQSYVDSVDSGAFRVSVVYGEHG
ncbi:MAG: alpha/beta hydrolase [Leptolyngbyaceae cyanobacterium T60_A2020_046]|nr:alpha/beta hydrolase [Leptolyngbyaceae cyanobacterium T60_A2020_046]